jgi:hypothetical protein
LNIIIALIVGRSSTVCFRKHGAGVGVDSALEQKKLKASLSLAVAQEKTA